MTHEIAKLAELLGAPIRPEHQDEVERAWRMMQPHRAKVMATPLVREDEPAPVFRP